MKSEWKKVRLDEIDIQIIDGDRGKNYPKSNEFTNEGYCLFLNAKNVTSSGFSFEQCMYISKEKDSLLRNGKLIRKDIILTTRGTIGNVAYYDEKVKYENIRINSGMVIIRCDNKNINSNFFYWVLRSNFIKNQINKIKTGSAQPQLPISIMKNIEVYLPSIITQNKISSILSALDNKIKINQKINENLEEQAQAIYEKLFMQNLNNDRVYCKIEDVFEISIGKTPPRKEKQWFSNDKNDYIWISISDMKDCGLYISDSSEYLTFDAIEKHNVKIIPDNTVILSFKLTVGRVAITDGITTTNEAIAHFKTDNKSINEYLYFYLKNFNYQSLGSTSSIATAINSKIVKKIPFILPTEKEIQYFSDIVSPMFKQIKNNQHEIVKLCKIRDVLLPKLMNGEIDVGGVEL